MQPLKISSAQFENRSGDKEYNLSVIEKLSREAAANGSDVIAFHECSVTGYTFARHLSKEQMLDIAEHFGDDYEIDPDLRIWLENRKGELRVPLRVKVKWAERAQLGLL